MSTTQLRPSAPPLTPADLAAHRAASFVRASAPGDSDPDADELLKRVRTPRSNLPVRRPGLSLLSVSICGVCRDAYIADTHTCTDLQVETEAAYLLRDRQPLDEYRQWAQGVAA